MIEMARERMNGIVEKMQWRRGSELYVVLNRKSIVTSFEVFQYLGRIFSNFSNT